MNVGRYEQHIDAKGRIILPGAFRQALGSSFIISAGFDRALCLWNPSDWEAFVEREISRRSDLSAQARMLNRWLHSSAHHVKLDSQKRFVVPPVLRREAQLEHQIILIGAGNRVEIWSRKNWEEYIQRANASIEEIAESLSRDLRV